MKKLFLTAILCLSLITLAHASNATITNTEYGSEITGGTSQTVVYNQTMYVKGIGYVPSAANNTVTFTSGANVSCLKIVAPTVNDTKTIYFGDSGITLSNLSVTLNTTTDIVYIYNK
jgi:hypothetical protein